MKVKDAASDVLSGRRMSQSSKHHSRCTIPPTDLWKERNVQPCNHTGAAVQSFRLHLHHLCLTCCCCLRVKLQIYFWCLYLQQLMRGSVVIPNYSKVCMHVRQVMKAQLAGQWKTVHLAFLHRRQPGHVLPAIGFDADKKTFNFRMLPGWPSSAPWNGGEKTHRL